ncbi:hypothetical protein DENSPDRAFT_109142 [Dentipellis sp. KUC8613]|nr:hypothetical protein DENSPDRAFT_109142 [Dentipellis sp. KUC8613]
MISKRPKSPVKRAGRNFPRKSKFTQPSQRNNTADVGHPDAREDISPDQPTQPDPDVLMASYHSSDHGDNGNYLPNDSTSNGARADEEAVNLNGGDNSDVWAPYALVAFALLNRLKFRIRAKAGKAFLVTIWISMAWMWMRNLPLLDSPWTSIYKRKGVNTSAKAKAIMKATARAITNTRVRTKDTRVRETRMRVTVTGTRVRTTGTRVRMTSTRVGRAGMPMGRTMTRGTQASLSFGR